MKKHNSSTTAILNPFHFNTTSCSVFTLRNLESKFLQSCSELSPRSSHTPISAPNSPGDKNRTARAQLSTGDEPAEGWCAQVQGFRGRASAPIQPPEGPRQGRAGVRGRRGHTYVRIARGMTRGKPALRHLRGGRLRNDHPGEGITRGEPVRGAGNAARTLPPPGAGPGLGGARARGWPTPAPGAPPPRRRRRLGSSHACARKAWGNPLGGRHLLRHVDRRAKPMPR